MLNRKSIVAIAAISTLAIVALAPTGASAMRGGFDGNWSVQIMTQRGACSAGVRIGVDIRNGVFYSSGGFDISGSVAGNGATRVRVSAGGQSASASGRLSGNSGSGTWRGVSSDGPCSGSWSASRR
jgi:hypothetical protein